VGVVQGADDRFALGDVQREYLHPVPVGVLEAGGERVVVDQAGELQDQGVADGDACQEHTFDYGRFGDAA
jgi:hypothetical protein